MLDFIQVFYNNISLYNINVKFCNICVYMCVCKSGWSYIHMDGFMCVYVYSNVFLCLCVSECDTCDKTLHSQTGRQNDDQI